ncbi:hypothetical protein LWI29_022564 [Acer saccharum]|uniref:Uncharacterized protein n=1 Tax=Acer saccharum TaxID=4024 RepID=A0AA39T3Z2_ACESA|nr:hypothetical protein LWI29_022564 [Acer saccharum]
MFEGQLLPLDMTKNTLSKSEISSLIQEFNSTKSGNENHEGTVGNNQDQHSHTQHQIQEMESLGDFNTVLDQSERKGGPGSLTSMRNFRRFIDSANVIDLPMQGMLYTWSNNRENESWARLDRFLCDPVLLSWFPKMVQKGLCKSLSDHNPVFFLEKLRLTGVRSHLDF